VQAAAGHTETHAFATICTSPMSLRPEGRSHSEEVDLRVGSEPLHLLIDVRHFSWRRGSLALGLGLASLLGSAQGSRPGICSTSGQHAAVLVRSVAAGQPSFSHARSHGMAWRAVVARIGHERSTSTRYKGRKGLLTRDLWSG
jgi:hypothetical protein